MYLNNANQIPELISARQFSIFVFPKSIAFPKIPTAVTIASEDKISIENIRQIEELVRTKQTSDLTIILESADHMTDQAQNCFLKLLEEPGDHIHFVFFIHDSSKLLPTVRSRAQIFTLKHTVKINSAPERSPDIIDLAKTYISASPAQFSKTATTIAKDRAKTLEMLDTAIELLYKSYFKTGNSKFLQKLQNLLHTYDSIAKNGHVRLQLIAGMI